MGALMTLLAKAGGVSIMKECLVHLEQLIYIFGKDLMKDKDVKAATIDALIEVLQAQKNVDSGS